MNIIHGIEPACSQGTGAASPGPGDDVDELESSEQPSMVDNKEIDPDCSEEDKDEEDDEEEEEVLRPPVVIPTVRAVCVPLNVCVCACVRLVWGLIFSLYAVEQETAVLQHAALRQLLNWDLAAVQPGAAAGEAKTKDGHRAALMLCCTDAIVLGESISDPPAEESAVHCGLRHGVPSVLLNYLMAARTAAGISPSAWEKAVFP